MKQKKIGMEAVGLKTPAHLFEVSWEVCNKVGGIHTVISTKSLSVNRIFDNNYILIGPDVWRYSEPNPEFTEDMHLFKSWRIKVAQDGLHVRIGRWNVAGNPIVILVDFTPFIAQKDQILSTFWQKFGLDSLNGQWDYIEPVLFGYAAGKVIESFIRYNISVRQHVLAHFHEWMTGSGLLYLKDAVPQVGCVFTTHATVLGRSVAGNGLPLYDSLNQYNPAEASMRFHVESKQSLESKAAEYADCFTTVSEITALECAHFLEKKVDMVTPNGFENSFVPSDSAYPGKRQAAREKLLSVARALTAEPIADDALLMGISGRYEYRNKGIDVYLDALASLNRAGTSARDLVAFVLVPAGYRGVNQALVENLQYPDRMGRPEQALVTHELTDFQSDPVVNRCRELQLNNRTADRVKVIFCPCYLNGRDGVFDLPYYDVLIGLDLSVFPSYYEPWGYTPLESLAFKVPTITTTLSGFGSWVETHFPKAHPGIHVIHRDDHNYDFVVESIAGEMEKVAGLDPKRYTEYADSAKAVSEIALWENLISYYLKAYEVAIKKVHDKMGEVSADDSQQLAYIERQFVAQHPNWLSVIVHRSIPEKLKALETLAMNLWWSWNEDAVDLFKEVDIVQWTDSRNPIMLLDNISMTRYKELENDDAFMARLKAVEERFDRYMEKKREMSSPGVAYFSMEYGLHSSLKIYSGGLGVLAGDYLKEASDSQRRITGIGLLYRYGYFTQRLSGAGDQESGYEAQDFTKIPVTPVRDEQGNWLQVSFPFPGRTVYARIWRVDVGRIELYLLDTDFEDNEERDRSITHHLYGGDWENRLKQEMLLGIGGVQALRALGISENIYHCNEGHAAFMLVERLREYVEEKNLSFTEALEVVSASSLFTTHTPVPAGHDSFDENMLRTYLSHYPERLKISWEQFIGMGRINKNDTMEKFSMSYLAASVSQETNGVSWLHGKVSRMIFKDLWPGYMPEELHIGYVTNGVHHGTWTAPEWKEIHHEVFGESFKSHRYDLSCFGGIHEVDDQRIMAVRNVLRKRLAEHIKVRLSEAGNTAYFSPRQLVGIKETLRDDILTIGFARRFATYKRAHLLFCNLERLSSIINNPDRPVQIVFAGKAHPADKAGQDLIKRIVEISKLPEFLGKILFLPDYDMDLARRMVQGVDVWMNTPTRPQEASGTSGMKAAMNGVMHFSVLDGWWVEGYSPDAGWALPMGRTYENQEFQNEMDAEMIYNILEDEIVPLFYDKNEQGYSPGWVSYIKNTIAKVASHFTTNRMLTDYEEKYYMPMATRTEQLIADNYSRAIGISEWKKQVGREWESIEVKSLMMPDKSKQLISLGKSYSGKVLLDIGELQPEDVGVELVISQMVDNVVRVRSTHEFAFVSNDASGALYALDITADNPGLFLLGVRIFPKNPLLPHRQNFTFVKWL